MSDFCFRLRLIMQTQNFCRSFRSKVLRFLKLFLTVKRIWQQTFSVFVKKQKLKSFIEGEFYGKNDYQTHQRVEIQSG